MKVNGKIRKSAGVFCAFLSIFTIFILSSCYEPSPLYGTWNDNNGDEIRFVSGGDEFSAKICIGFDETKGEAVTKLYTGTYSYTENSLTLDYVCSTDASDSGTIYTPWDLFGSVLTLKWKVPVDIEDPTGEQKELVLTLYHTAK